MDKALGCNAFYNGDFAPYEDIKIPLSDRCIFFGDGIYEAAPVLGGRVFFGEAHLDRFYKNAACLGIPVNYKRQNLRDIFNTLISAAGDGTYFLYYQLSRSSKSRRHAYDEGGKSNLLVTLTPLSLPSPDKRAHLILREDKRYKLCNIKTLNLLPAVLASHEAELLGADETVFSRDGIITECAHSNVHIIKDGALITHPLDEFILPGISRAHLLKVCRRLGVGVFERCFDERELFSADEVLITSSSKLAVLAEEVEGKSFTSDKNSIGSRLVLTMHEDFFRLAL